MEYAPRHIVDANYILWKRQQELLDLAQDLFSILTSIVRTRNTSRIEFHRGFCSEVRIPLEDYLQVDDQIPGILPRFRLCVTGVSRDPIAFLASRFLECVTSITFVYPRLTWPGLFTLGDSSLYTYLISGLPRLVRLDQLDLSYSDLIDESLRILDLGSCASLVDLRLAFNQITDTGVTYVLNSGVLQQLRYFNLSHNPITNHSAFELADHLGRSSNLKHLVIRNTYINRAGQQALLSRLGSRVDLF